MLETPKAGLQNIIMAELRNNEPRDLLVHVFESFGEYRSFTNYNVDSQCLKQYEDGKIIFAIPLNKIKMIEFTH